MSDFRHMFPNMDEEVIEAVLRANNGAVDETIDQLLTMNVDCTTDEAPPPTSTANNNSQQRTYMNDQDLPPQVLDRNFCWCLDGILDLIAHCIESRYHINVEQFYGDLCCRTFILLALTVI